MADVTPTLSYLCTEVQTKFPTNCSGAVKYIAGKMNQPLPDLPANGLINWFNANWTTLNEDQAQNFANSGRFVVAGKKVVGGSGHVVVVLPGGKQKSGGYTAISKSTGKTFTAKDYGMFPKSCSTAASSWAGAHSNGGKTTFDAWGSPSNYEGVKYWVAPAQLPSAK